MSFFLLLNLEQNTDIYTHIYVCIHMYMCICMYIHIIYCNINYNSITTVPSLNAYYALSTVIDMLCLTSVSYQQFDMGIVSRVLQWRKIRKFKH